ncbi:multiheme c-type cytochrome [Hyalangium rubrum]|uniref:Cytochrome c3 family protein n=1 Tax=Hyalangium rubrum TaxID=3103134 RepID=A0ABU5GUB2_9BACT|nr:multiheme c-type cytochrome [Hyalangium sp. s54d21]MDY7224765.1 cytochrome c3 family protein [Hyalangium sp. s54d21]
MRALGFWLLPLLVVSGVAGAADFVGPESCKGCHPAAYTAWQQSKHARAADSLTESQKKDARCLSCHAPDQAQQNVASVTCETCHGGGQYYSPGYVMKDPELSRLVGLVDPSEKMCRTCHDASSPSLRPFNFVESLKAIDHWSAERAKKSTRAEAPSPPPAKK